MPKHPYDKKDLAGLEFPRHMHKGGSPGEAGQSIIVADSADAELKQKDGWYVDASEAMAPKAEAEPEGDAKKGKK